MNKYQREMEKLLSKYEKDLSNELLKAYQSIYDEVNQEAEQLIEDMQAQNFSKAMQAERLKLIKEQLQVNIDKLQGINDGKIYDYLDTVSHYGYNELFYNFEQSTGIKLSFSMLNPMLIETIIQTPVASRKLSTRLQGNVKKLKESINHELTRGFAKGESYGKIARRIANIGESKYRRAMTIARTEGGRVSAITRQKSQNDITAKGVEIQKQWSAALDKRTRSDHAQLDGTTIPIDDYFKVSGYKALQPHMFGEASEDCNCRCRTISVIKGYEPKLRRDNETHEVGAYKNYQDWYDTKLREQELNKSSGEFGADLAYIRSDNFKDKFVNDPRVGHIADNVVSVAKKITQHRNGTPFEDYYLLDYATGKTLAVSNQARVTKGVVYNEQVRKIFKEFGIDSLVSIHNHPSSYPPSLSDIASLQQKSKNNSVGIGLTVGHDGSCYWYTKPTQKLKRDDNNKYDKLVDRYEKMGYTVTRAQEIALLDYAKLFGFKFGKVGD